MKKNNKRTSKIIYKHKPKKIYAGESKIHDRGLFSLKNIKKGEVVCIIKGPKMFKINKTKKDSLSHPDWVGFKKHNWVDPMPPYKYLNHSCNPNLGIKGKKSLIAIKNIKKDEEITLDYSITEVDQKWYMNCSCGEKNCRKVIKSIQYLPKNVYYSYDPYISKDFKKIYLEYNIKNGKKI